MERYAEYKRSGIEWVGDIPSNWVTPEIAYLTTSFNGATPSRDVPEYWNGDIPWMASGEVHQKYVTHTNETITQAGLDSSSTRVLPAGTVMIALNGQGRTKGTCAILGIDACCNQSLAGFICDHNLNNRWLFYCFEAMYEYLRGEGGQAQRDGIAASDLRHERIPLPELGVQSAIVNYLDIKTAEIESLIEETEKSIELLEEYRKSVISEVVTKGLNPDVPMKDSGIEWIREIPEHWRISKVKYELINHDNLRKPVEASQRSQLADVLYPYYGASGIVDYIDDYIFDGKRILIGEDGANLVLRNLPLIYVADGKYWVNNHAHILEPGSNVDFDYIAMQLEMIDLTNFITGSAQPKLSQSNLGMVPIVVPPKEEQAEIVESLDNRITVITKIIDERVNLLEKLKELRKSTISEAVTGKFKVPGVM